MLLNEFRIHSRCSRSIRTTMRMRLEHTKLDETASHPVRIQNRLEAVVKFTMVLCTSSSSSSSTTTTSSTPFSRSSQLLALGLVGDPQGLWMSAAPLPVPDQTANPLPARLALDEYDRQAALAPINDSTEGTANVSYQFSTKHASLCPSSPLLDDMKLQIYQFSNSQNWSRIVDVCGYSRSAVSRDVANATTKHILWHGT
ncbi:hypothetical protein BGZ60DRAFT_126905 [Tricladium varicosporioides]|nr:hypothetical protein BGZ60DRAFT_126905 [Hymenoscyphus varicosporioides]